MKFEQIEGDKAGSIWLLVDDTFVCNKNQGSELETFWECSGRRQYRLVICTS